MPDTRPASKIDLICRCSGVTRQQIQALVGRGVDNQDRLSRITGVCSGCGGCESDVSVFLAALLEQAAQ
ncbi:MAG: (2Fe-2S)-binding protein [Methylococcales bacterium]|nr:(2Fe-2S)-binding protein [Methylococcales bacterium]